MCNPFLLSRHVVHPRTKRRRKRKGKRCPPLPQESLGPNMEMEMSPYERLTQDERESHPRMPDAWSVSSDEDEERASTEDDELVTADDELVTANDEEGVRRVQQNVDERPVHRHTPPHRAAARGQWAHDPRKVPPGVERRYATSDETLHPGAHGFREDVPRNPRATRGHLKRLWKMSRLETEEYDPAEMDVERRVTLRLSNAGFRRQEIYKYCMAALIGMVVAPVAFLVKWAVAATVSVKFSLTRDTMPQGFAPAYFVLVGWSVGAAALGSALIAIVFGPLAGGSGIPEMVTYLNGIHVPGQMRLSVFLGKSIGVVFTQLAGLLAGREGPFVAIGGIVGSGISQLGSATLNWSLDTPGATVLREPVNHRDFASIGTAAGVACAFKSPIGGVLFMIEEGASFFSSGLFWRALLATCVGVASVSFWEALREDAGGFMTYRFGLDRDFGILPDDEAEYGRLYWYYFWELPLFTLFGAVTGLLMSAFVSMHSAVMRARRHLKIHHGRHRVLTAIAECACVALLTCTIVFLATWFSGCADIPAAYETASEEHLHEWFERGNCAQESQYSLYGQLFFNSLGNTASLLFNLDTVSLNGQVQPFEFDVGALFAYSAMTFFVTTITFGLGIPTGVFIPSLLTGACWGNLYGRLVAHIAASPGIDSDIAISLHTYTAVGAGAALAGVSRMTLSVCVIVIEATGSYPVLVPIMLSVFTARAVGDLLTPSIYKNVIKFRGTPFMEEHKLDGVRYPVSDKLNVSDVMTEALVSLPPVITVQRLVDLLKTHRHGAFPVTDDQGSASDRQPDLHVGKEVHGSGIPFYGAVRRDTLLKILEHRIGFASPGACTPDPKGERRVDVFRCAREKGTLSSDQKLVAQLQALPFKPRSIEDLEKRLVADGSMESEIDVTPFMSRDPYTTSSAATLRRAYRLFRTLGLRHLWVVAPVPHIVGVVTRKDIIEDNATLVFAEKIASHMAEEGALYAGPSMRATTPYNAPLVQRGSGAMSSKSLDELPPAAQPSALHQTTVQQRRRGQAPPPSPLGTTQDEPWPAQDAGTPP